MRHYDDYFRVDRHVDGAAVIVTATGEVDMTTAPVLAGELDLAMADVAPPGPVVADLRAVHYFGSSGITALLEARDHCERQASDLRLLANTVVIRPLSLTGTDHMFTVCSSLVEALGPRT